MKNIEKSTKNKLKAGGIVFLVLGIMFVSISIFSPLNREAKTLFGKSAETKNVATISNNIQEITIDLKSRGYDPIIVQKGIPVKFNIRASKESINGCNATVIIPDYNIEKTLVPGDNIIEFTPEDEGEITYTCWMGMIRSSIQVVSDI